MKKKQANKRLNQKGSQLKRDLKSLGRSGASFVPGLGLGLSIHDTTKKTIRTAHTANRFGKELINEVRRQVKRRNPFQ